MGRPGPRRGRQDAADPADAATLQQAEREKRETNDFLQAAYELILGRSIDEGGREAYAGIMAVSGPYAGPLRVIDSLLQSDEFRRRSGQGM